MYKTYVETPSTINKEWRLIDADGLVLGRLASIIAKVLRGKDKPTFTPNMDCGDNVVVINAEKIVLTGKKYHNKIYNWHTGYPGGIKSRSARQISENGTHEILRMAVSRMISRGPLQRKLMANLRIFRGSEHSHASQSPRSIEVALMNRKNKK